MLRMRSCFKGSMEKQFTKLVQKQTCRLGLSIPHYEYHPSYLMDSKHDDRFVKIDRRAFHLYKDMILKLSSNKLNQKTFMIVLIDCVRTKQAFKDFQELVHFGIQHLDQFQQLQSLISFSSQLYLYNYPNRQHCYQVALQVFKMLKSQPFQVHFSYQIMKFLIFLQKCVGLQKFPNQTYSQIRFNNFKPLFLSFIIQFFCKNQLQHYPILNSLIQIFTSRQDIIPFADLHHYRQALKIVTHPDYVHFVQTLENSTLLTHEQGSQPHQSHSQFDPEEPTPLYQQNHSQQYEQTTLTQQSSVEANTLRHKNYSENNQNQVQTKNYAQTKNQSQTKGQGQTPSLFPWNQIYKRQLHKRFTYFP